MNRIELTIDGMMCGQCEAHVKDAIRKRFPSAKHVTASHSRRIASFELEENMPKPMVLHELHAGIDPAGYRILDMKMEEVQEKKKRFLFF